MVKIIEVDDESGNIFEKQYFPKELQTICKQINDHYAGGFCQFEKSRQNFLCFAIFDVINSKYIVMVNNWAAEPEEDSLVVFEINQP